MWNSRWLSGMMLQVKCRNLYTLGTCIASASYEVLLNFPVPRIYAVNGAVSGLYPFRFSPAFPRCLKIGQFGHSLVNQIGYFDRRCPYQGITQVVYHVYRNCLFLLFKNINPLLLSVRGVSILGYGWTIGFDSTRLLKFSLHLQLLIIFVVQYDVPFYLYCRGNAWRSQNSVSICSW